MDEWRERSRVFRNQCSQLERTMFLWHVCAVVSPVVLQRWWKMDVWEEKDAITTAAGDGRDGTHDHFELPLRWFDSSESTWGGLLVAMLLPLETIRRVQVSMCVRSRMSRVGAGGR
jgi:hypothetical protein